jgi:integrase/recombinase XerD
MKEVHIEILDNNTFALSFDEDDSMTHALGRIPPNRRDNDRNAWLFDDRPEIGEAIRTLFHDYRMTVDHSKANAREIECLVNELKSRKYSPKTVKSYAYYNREFIEFSRKPASIIEERDIAGFLAHPADVRSFNESSLELVISALKFFYSNIMGRKILMEKKRPKKDRRLPAVLSKEQVMRVPAVTINLKHKAILTLVYSSGLRVSEITKLRYGDIESDRRMVYIRRAKGRKDRYTILSRTAFGILERYVRLHHPGNRLFPGQNRENHVSIRTVEKVFKNACARAGIPKDVSIHSLGHSFATHLLENGTDIRYIRTLLGHASVKTTSIHTHVAKHDFIRIESPLDSM